MTEKVKAALKVGDPFRTSFPYPNIFYLQASKKLDEKAKLDVLELLGQLEGELQAKDIAIATLKVNYSVFQQVPDEKKISNLQEIRQFFFFLKKFVKLKEDLHCSPRM